MAIKRYFLWLSVLAVLSSCSMQEEVDIDLPTHTPVTLIECYLEPGQPAKALATRSLGYFDESEVAAANDLRISLHHKGRSIHLVNSYVVDSARRIAYNYYSTDTILYLEGASWEMIVSDKEKEIARGTATFLSKPVIKSIDYTIDAQDNIVLDILLEDNPASEDYYRVLLHQGGSPAWGDFDGLWTDEKAKDGVLKIITGQNVLLYGGWVAVSVYHLDKSHYEFIRSLDKARDANYNPFSQPANIRSNLVGESMGVFTAVSGIVDTVHIKR